jgi:plasmid maintenance system antidote protein VapI
MMLSADDDVTDLSQTSPEESREMLEAFCENGFDGSIEAAALALGRDDNEIEELLTGESEVDDDLLMKIRGIAQQRHIDIGTE